MNVGGLSFEEEQALIKYAGGSETYQPIDGFNYQLIIDNPKAFRTQVEAQVRAIVGDTELTNKHLLFNGIRARLWTMGIDKMIDLFNQHKGELRSIALQMIKEFQSTQVPKSEIALLEV